MLIPFENLTAARLYDILKLRSEVFVVEQNSPYLDPDGYDQHAHHYCQIENGTLVAYSRILAPGVKFAEATVGRLVIAESHRGKGLGRQLMQRSMEAAWELYGDVPIRIEAQYHLRNFYQSLGFAIVSDIYDWGGIDHVKMLVHKIEYSAV